MRAKDKLILAGLAAMHPTAKPELDFTTPFELLIATILSAQTTDIQVNKVTLELFQVANTAKKMATFTNNQIEEYIKTLGLYHNKAKNLINTANCLLENFNGEVPSTLAELLTLPGVGRKTANVVISNAFGIPAIAVDTHVFRVSNRLGLAKAKNVLETEKQLQNHIPKSQWSIAHHWLIFHGRRICKARNPLCDICCLINECSYFQEQKKKSVRSKRNV
ncbi:MAG: endonuclease III [Clostridia bacterium]